MNYAGKFDATTSSAVHGEASHSDIHVETVHGHAPADAIIIPDAQFLFHADFKRSGLDLVLHQDDHELVLHDYFKGDKRVALASPDGAHLNGDLVNALTGSVDVAQAGAPAAAGQVIGHVTKLAGSATAIRNGVSIILNMGDNVEKGDVVQSGSDSTLGITFIDGTVFGLSSNARMVLNEMVYDPNGTNNSSLLSLVAGTITFVAGETAKHGDMKVDTPVATMGIRGTAVLVEIDFTVPGQGGTPDAKFQVLVEPDGTTGSYILFDKTTLQPIAVVNQAGQQINISNGIISQTTAPLSPDIQKLITDVFSLKFSDNSQTNPHTTTAQTDTANPQLVTGQPVKLANGDTATPIVQITGSSGGSGPNQTPNNPSIIINHIPDPPTVVVVDSHGNVATNFALTELASHTGDLTDHDMVGGTIRFADINGGDLPTTSVALDHIDYKGAVVNSSFHLVSGSLSNLELADLQGAGITVNVVPASTNNNNGSATWTYSVADKAFDFLAAGETLVLTYTVKVDNNYTPFDQAGTATITITITGTNDAPVITTSAQTIAFSGGQDTPGGMLSSSDPTSGQLKFTDVDLDDTHTAAVKDFTAVMSNGSEISQGLHDLFQKALTVSINTDSTGTGQGVVDWKLAQLPVYLADFIPAGQTLTLTYTVAVTDSHGATSDQNVTVTITGTDNPAVVWIATSSGESSGASWNDAANWETLSVPTAKDDVVIITDQLIGLTPSYPVTIDEAAFAHSLTMKDYPGDYGEDTPKLYNYSSLTIGGKLSLSVDAVLHNYGIITVGDVAEFTDSSQLENAGTLTLQNGGEFSGTSSITNDSDGTIEVSGGTLSVSVTVTNYGQITVDVGAALALGGGTIDGGTVSVVGIPIVKEFSVAEIINDGDGQGGVQILGNGVLELHGFGVLENGTLDNTGTIKVTGAGNALHNETVTADTALEVEAGGALLIDQGTTIANNIGGVTTVNEDGKSTDSGGTITVDATASLTVNDATITGGTVTNEAGGILALTGSATLQDGVFGNSGQMNVSGSGNLLDGEAVTNNGTGAIDMIGGLMLQNGSSITNGEGNAETVENHASVRLNDTSFISGGLVANQGTLTLADSSELDDGQLDNTGSVHVSGSGVVFDGEAVNNTGSGAIDITGALTLEETSTISNGEGNTETVEQGASLTLQDGSSITGGKLINLGAVHIESSTGATFEGVNVNNSGGTIQVDDDLMPPVTLLLDDGTTITGGKLDVQSVGTLEISGSAGATFSGVEVDNFNLVQVEHGSVLVLDHATITGGTVDNGDTIHVTGDSAIDGAALGNGQVNIDSDVTLTLDDTTVTGTSFSGALVLDSGHTLTLDNVGLDGTLSNGGTLTIDFENTLTLNDGTITGGSVVNDGTINSTGISAIDGAGITNNGLIAAISGTLTIDPGTFTNTATLQANGGELDISSETVDNTGTIGAIGGGTLKLISSTIDNSGDGGMTVDSGATLDLDNSSILGGTLTLSGTLNNSAGSNVITAAITDNGGSIEVTGGSLDLAGTLSGDVDISGAATLELGATGTSAYAQTTVTFDTGSTGTLILDHAGTFTGTVAGLDDNTIDLADISYASCPTVCYAGGVLSVYVDGMDVANINLTGDYSGVTWVLADDGSAAHGTTITEDPGVISGLDADGNADQGTALNVSITDGGAAVTDVKYDWQVSSDGVHWSAANGSNGQSSYTPVGADDGQQLRVSLSFTDSSGNPETSTVSAGTVRPDLSVTLDSSGVSEGRTIHVTSVTEGGTPVSDVTYDWQVSSDGVTWTEANGINGHSSYTPVVADENQDLRLVTTFAGGPAGPQSAINELGAVQTPTITITVETANGVDFAHHDVPALMGAGIVRPDGSSSFTVIDAHHHVQFVVTGSNFTYDGSEVTSGTITSFEEFTTGAKSVALANFTGLSVDATTWMTDVELDAHGFKGPLKALTSTFAYDFIGGPGNDSFGIGAPAGEHTTLTGGAGSDLFQYQKGYGAVTITDFDQGNTGIFAQSEGDKIELDGFNGKPSITYVNGNTVADFGHGDVLTLLGVNPQDLKHSDFIWVSSGDRSDERLEDGIDTKFAVADDGKGGTDTVLNHPVIDTTHFSVQQNKNGTDTIFGLHVSDSDPDSAASLSLSASTESAPGSTVSPSSSSGTLDDINSALTSGITYNPGTPQPQADMINVTVTDNFGASDTVHFVFNQAGQGPNINLQGTSGDDVISERATATP